jgi:hypothetical protein
LWSRDCGLGIVVMMMVATKKGKRRFLNRAFKNKDTTDDTAIVIIGTLLPHGTITSKTRGRFLMLPPHIRYFSVFVCSFPYLVIFLSLAGVI